jgi:hypothetical protein
MNPLNRVAIAVAVATLASATGARENPKVLE